MDPRPDADRTWMTALLILGPGMSDTVSAVDMMSGICSAELFTPGEYFDLPPWPADFLEQAGSPVCPMVLCQGVHSRGSVFQKCRIRTVQVVWTCSKPAR